MKTTLMIMASLFAVPAMGQFWKPADPTTARSIQPSPGESVKSYTEAPKVPPPAYSRRPVPAVARDPTPIDLPPEKSQALGEVCFGVVKKVFKFFDPYSAKLDEQRLLRMPNQNLAIVIEVNAKNRFGAYIGAQPFYCILDDQTLKLVDAGKGEP